MPPRRLLTFRPALLPWSTTPGSPLATLRGSRFRCSSTAPKEPSLYQKLFPESTSPPRRPRNGRRSVPDPTQKPLRSLLMKDMKAWGWEDSFQEHGGKLKAVGQAELSPPSPDVHAESANQMHAPTPVAKYSIHGSSDDGKTGKDSESYNGPTVLVLNAASKSLLESDFYRLGPQGRHLEGWTSGIVKVVQSRSPTTKEPLGQYTIHFDSRAAALAYMDEVNRLLSLSRQAAGLNWRAAPRDPIGPLPLAPALGAVSGGEGDIDARIQAFTLIPPSAALNLRIKDARPRSDTSADEDGKEVLDRHKVLVWLDGAQISADTLLVAIREDGIERNLPWRLGDTRQPIEPVTPSAGANRPTSEESAEGEQTSSTNRIHCSRFIVSLADTIEAKRFARNWHKRDLSLSDRGRTVVVNAFALW
ncbi:hypothetical protein VTK73DRAFT_4903 [Phialemonium thermophilum]|uniref:Uncharacterized protein n=1 Tax=Phialemonium thermophilum TaxID=223376 RepID=A0ABR3WR19_9PEZI